MSSFCMKLVSDIDRYKCFKIVLALIKGLTLQAKPSWLLYRLKFARFNYFFCLFNPFYLVFLFPFSIIPLSHAALSAQTVKVIEGNAPYLLLSDGTITATWRDNKNYDFKFFFGNCLPW